MFLRNKKLFEHNKLASNLRSISNYLHIKKDSNTGEIINFCSLKHLTSARIFLCLLLCLCVMVNAVFFSEFYVKILLTNFYNDSFLIFYLLNYKCQYQF